jgi:asparagine synthase (glutamine-hydrolysing)
VFDPCERNLRELSALLDRMCARITYEQWYQTHTYVQPYVAGGRVGLGIINPQPQPASNEDGSVLAWMDGEIYDYQRQDLNLQLQRAGHGLLGHGDAELIVHRYEDLGVDCVADLDGTFAVAIYDARGVKAQQVDGRCAKLILLVDREASRPLFYYADGGRVTFASEVKAILEDGRVPRKVDEQAVIELFSMRHVLADRTLFQDIRFLPAGHWAAFQDGHVHGQSYWMPRLIEDRPPLPYETYVDEIVAALRRAMERQMYDWRPIGEYLSGGLDSRTLLAASDGLTSLSDGSFHTFSRGPRDCWDVRFGEKVAQRVGSQHHYLALQPGYLLDAGRRGVWISDGLMTVNDIYALGTIQQVKPHIDVVFLGNGRMDGILGGIELDHKLLRAKSLDQAARSFYAHNSVFMPEKIQARVFAAPFHRRTNGLPYDALRQMMSQYESDTFHGKVEGFCIQCRWPRSANWGAILSRTQVETRSPYSDNDFCDLVCRVPARWRTDRRMQLAVLKRAWPELARIRWATSGLPASISRPKVLLAMRAYFRARREIESLTGGRIPPVLPRERAYYAQWYRTVLRPWLEGTLLDERTLDRGYYDREGIRALIREHMSGHRDRSIQFGLLLTFELWNRLFMDGEMP